MLLLERLEGCATSVGSALLLRTVLSMLLVVIVTTGVRLLYVLRSGGAVVSGLLEYHHRQSLQRLKVPLFFSPSMGAKRQISTSLGGGAIVTRKAEAIKTRWLCFEAANA